MGNGGKKKGVVVVNGDGKSGVARGVDERAEMERVVLGVMALRGS